MKPFSLFISTIILFICSSCLDIHIDKQSKIDTQAIANRVKESVEVKINEIDLQSVNLNDTLAIAPDTSSVQKSAITKPAPIVIEKINVEIKDDYWRTYNFYYQYHMVIIIVCSICILTFAIVVIFLIFFYKRTKSRNALIEKAIENSYNLPDSFYTARESEPSMVYKMPNTTDTVDNGPTPPPVPRDIQQFNSAVKYISVGIGIFFIFGSCDADPIAAVGIIPVLIGAGKLLAYFGIGR